jgi:hypothetical protein
MVSSDSGASFEPNAATLAGGNNAVPSGVAVSELGNYQIMVENNPSESEGEYGGIVISDTSGIDWREVYYADGSGGTAKFSGCAVSQTSPSSNPIFVAAGVISAELPDPPLQPVFMYCRGVPTDKNSWTVVSSYGPTPTDFVNITSVEISNDGTRLVVLDTGGVTKVIVFYQITAGAVTYRTHINVANITGDGGTYTDLTGHVISNISSAGFTLVAADSTDIISFQASWPGAAANPILNSDSSVIIRSSGGGDIAPTKIVSSSDAVYQLVQCNDITNNSTYTYLSSNQGGTWSLIPQNNISPFSTLATIAMSADASRIYCLGKESDNTFKQALRTSLSVGSYIQTAPTTALTYRATGPTGPTGGPTGPYGQPTTQIASHLLPTTDATYDLGATGLQFRDAFFSGTLYNNGTPFSGGGATTGLTYRATGPTGPTGGPTGPNPDPTIQIGTHLVPTEDLTYDLGATGLRFRDMYVGGSTIYLGDTVTLSGSAGTLSVNSAPLVSNTTVQNTGAGGIGVTFTEKILSTAMNNTNAGNIAMSANGQYITYIPNASQTYIFVSSDSGATFTEKGDQLSYTYVTVSSTGQYQAALVDSNGVNSGVYFSSDYGLTWANVMYGSSHSADNKEQAFRCGQPCQAPGPDRWNAPGTA